MDQQTLIELIFSITPKLTALLMVVFIYALQRYEGVRKSELAGEYKRLVLFIFVSIMLSVLCAFSSFLMLTGVGILTIELMFYLTISLFWGCLALLIITCIIIIKDL